MPTFRTDFRVSADRVIETDATETLYEGAEFKITLRNGATDPDGHIEGLVATVIGPAAQLDDAENEHRAFLAQKLDFLTLSTLVRFEIIASVRAIEWEPGMPNRRMLIFYAADDRYPPLPDLDGEVFSSVRILSANAPAPYVATALKYFRFGIREKSKTDQFIKFWHALEVIAENIKEKERVAIICRGCNAPLVCTCGTSALRTPMAKEGVLQVLTLVKVDNPAFVSEKLYAARNTLMHGGSAETVEKKTGKPLNEVINILGSIVQAAILTQLDMPEGNGSIDVRRDLGLIDILGRAELIFHSVDGSVYPDEAHIPDAKISIHHELRPLADNEYEPGVADDRV